LIGETIGVFVALAIVLALAWFVLRFLQRVQVGVGGGALAPLRYGRALPVGPRERVVVVVYHDEELLLGVTAGGVTLLDRRPYTPPPEQPALSPIQAGPVADRFREMLNRAARRPGGNGPH
jgi:flagellar protein FliO/FliZ